MTCAEGRLILAKLDMSRAPPEIRYSIRVHVDMTWKASVYSMELTTRQLTAGVPVLLSTTAALRSLLVSLDSGHLCEGNRDGKVQELLSYQGFSGSSSKC